MAPRIKSRRRKTPAALGLKLALRFAKLARASLDAMTPKPAKAVKKRRPAAKPIASPAVSRRTPSMTAGQHIGEFGSRAYKIYRPGPEAAFPKGPPLLVMLHGCGQTPDDFAKGTGMTALAQAHGFIVVYPAQPREAHPNCCWNWFLPAHQNRDAGEPAIIASLTRELVVKHGADPARVYIAGLSAGASMALIVARAYPDLFAAVGAHSGLPAGAAHDQTSAMIAMQRGNPGWRLTQPMPTIVLHGSLDPVVNPRNGRLIAIRARQPYPSLRSSEVLGQVPNGRAYSKTVHRIGAGRALVENWNIKASGHAWSGGSNGRFTDPKGPNASAEMIRFFLRHTLTARRRAELARLAL